MTTVISTWWNDVIAKHGDPRVNDWMLCSNPMPAIAIISVYLLLIYVIVPKYMENRPAYKMKTYLICYNLFQIVASFLLMCSVYTAGWSTYYSWGCQPVDYSDHPLALKMLRNLHYGVLLKIIEMTETVVFGLRKKQNQISKLHVYHHVSTLMFAWLACRFVGGGMFTLTGIINCFIHVLMYTYYLLASLGPEWQKVIAKWKSTLTTMQMIQFCIIVAHMSIALKPDCDVPKLMVLLYIPNIIVLFYMFRDFYKKNYNNKSSTKVHVK